MTADLPWKAFRFRVDFREESLQGQSTDPTPVCGGAFAACSGLEATMEPKVIRAGGQNWGAAQRVGPVSFATVILKRGMTATRDLSRWFELVNDRGFAYRLTATVTMLDHAGEPAVAWQLTRCLPVKFKAAELDAKSGDVAIEELHLAHEGMRAIAAGQASPGGGR